MLNENITTVEKIPIMVGVTGHRDLRGQDIPILHDVVIEQLQTLIDKNPHSKIAMLNSLASGADTLCAKCARELGVELICALPFEIEEYENDFNAEELVEFKSLIDYASDVFIAPFTEPEPEIVDRDFMYRQAGIYVASHTHMLLALWDGTPHSKGNCGTADVLDLHLNGTYISKKGRTIHTGKSEAVLHVLTPRMSTNGDEIVENVGEIRWMGSVKNFKELVKKTDEFNRLAPSPSEAQYPLLPENTRPNDILKRIALIYHEADISSLKNAATYKRILKSLAILGTGITFGFLLYDEAEWHFLILACGIMLVMAIYTYYFAGKTACHTNYVEHRTLAEGLRVQAFLRYAGSKLEVAELFTWSQQLETEWIMKALCAISVGSAPTEKNSIVECWIQSQHDYHKNAIESTKKLIRRNDRIVIAAVILSIIFYLLGLAYEIMMGTFIIGPFISPKNPEVYRTALKILLGSISAGALFAANYYGKQSLNRKASDHEKMQIFYKKMETQIVNYGQSEELLRLLAHEELIENSNWCAYQLDNTLDLAL